MNNTNDMNKQKIEKNKFLKLIYDVFFNFSS